MDWTVYNIQKLEILVRQNWTARQIAEELNCSRSAVLGKVRRLGLTLNGSVSSRCIKPRKKAMHPRCETIEIPVSKSKTIVDLNLNDCRWPEGEGPFTFCGADAVMGRPYCAYHCGIAYERVKEVYVPRKKNWASI